MKQILTVIAPMYNEEAIVYEYTKVSLEVLSKLKDKYDYEILFVNDGSKDNTLERITEMQEKYPDVIGVINLSRNFGLEGAISAALKTTQSDMAIVMDADLQDPPTLILEMVEKYEAGADIVVASRKKRQHDSFFKRLTANIYYKLLDALAGKLKLERSAANYRLLSRRAINKLNEFPEVNSTFRVLVPFIGMKTALVEYERDKRGAGKTNYNFSSLLRSALDGLTSISIEPLRRILWTLPVVMIVLIGSLSGIFLANDIWVAVCTVVLIISVFFGLLFICIAIVGEYIAQIMIEVKHRPTSIIYEYSPSKNSKR
jgi:dolichol-phosphate mannosyltransferase